MLQMRTVDCKWRVPIKHKNNSGSPVVRNFRYFLKYYLNVFLFVSYSLNRIHIGCFLCRDVAKPDTNDGADGKTDQDTP